MIADFDNEFTEVMGDIETGGHHVDAWIAQIACGVMKPSGLEMPFEATIGYKHPQKGRALTADTMAGFWANPKHAKAFEQVWFKDGLSLYQALHGLENHIDSIEQAYGKRVRFWTKGPSFDVSILTHAYRQFDEEFPVHFRNIMCYRTVAAMFPQITMEHAMQHFHNDLEEPLYHTAYSDVLHQGRHLIYIMSGFNRE